MPRSHERAVHLLLVEDDDAHAELVMLELQDKGASHSVARVRDGAEAIAYLTRSAPFDRAARPDVVLLDLKLPKVDGHEVLTFIKDSPALCMVPVVVLTTSEAESDRARAYAHRANSYVVKPVDLEKFQRLVTELDRYWGSYNMPPPSRT
jgi:CheY-like chemotaxis protein